MAICVLMMVSQFIPKENLEMRKERKVLVDRIDMLNAQWNAELELGCGFFSKVISNAFSGQINELREKLAMTYNMSFAEYEQYVFERMMLGAYNADDVSELPFN